MPDKIIDRDTYRTIKKMSREEMQAFLMRYAEGLKEESPPLDLRELEKDIKGVKGIGEKRAEEIMQIREPLKTMRKSAVYEKFAKRERQNPYKSGN